MDTMDEAVKHVDDRILALVGGDDESPTKFPCYDIPPADFKFLGREPELEAIQADLGLSKVEQSLRAFAIYGLGGIGKSSLALAFAELCKQLKTYDAIFWIRGETPADMRDSFTDIALRLELFRASSNADSDSNVVLVKNWLAKTTKKWLLIYDNIEEMSLLIKYLPPASGCMLVTTRFRHLATKLPNNGSYLELKALAPAESLRLFESARLHYDKSANSSLEQDATSTMLAELGGLPLGIVQIAAYIGYREISISDFVVKYKKMASHIHRNIEGVKTKHSLATVWDMHFENIHGKCASRLLGLISVVSPDEIDLELFVPDMLDFLDDEGDLEDAIDLLVKVALVRRKGNVVSLHRLVQAAFIQSAYGLANEGLQSAFNDSAALLCHKFPRFGGPKSLHGRWKECSMWFHHVDALAHHFERMEKTRTPIKSTPDFDELLKNAAWYQYEIGELSECLRILDIAYQACLDKEGLIYAYHCNTAACVYYELNDLIRCRESLEKSLKIRLAKLKPDDADFANTHSNMAKLFMSEVRFEEALRSCEDAIEARTRSGTAGAEYLAMSYMERGRIEFMGKHLEQAEADYKKSESLFIVSGTENGWLRGALFYAMGNAALAKDDLTKASLTDARELYLHAFRICSKLGPTQILIAAIHFKLGVTATKNYDFDEAYVQFKAALVIAEYRQSRGEIARIIRGRAIALEQDTRSTDAEKREAEMLRLRSEMLRMQVSEDLQIGVISESQDEDEAYNSLLCGYFR